MRNSFATTVGALASVLITACTPGAGNNPSNNSADSSPAVTTGAPMKSSREAKAGSTEPKPSTYVPGEILVKYRDGALDSDVIASKLTASGRASRKFRSVRGLQQLRLASGVSVDSALAELRAHAEVEYAEPNYIYHQAASPGDPEFARQWGLHNTGQTQGTADADIDAPEAWDVTTGSASVVVAVIDSGIDYNHQDLAANMFRNTPDCNGNAIDDDGNGYVDDCYGIDTTNGDSNPMDDEGHGTHVAGIIGARGNNGIGVAGVAWNTSLVACKFIDATGSGDAADAIACLDYVAALKDRGINIVATNNSWGNGVSSRALEEAIVRQRQRGILFVAAAGNAPGFTSPRDLDNSEWFHESGTSFPCAYQQPNVICVAASTDENQWERFSYYGPHSVHVFAPGENIYSTLPNNAYGELSGTSMAAPHVTGVIALLKSATPALTWLQTRNRVIAGGDFQTNDTRYPDFGWAAISRRRVNALGAITCSNARIQRRVQPRTPYGIDPHPIGGRIPLAVINVNCNGGDGPVSVNVNPGSVAITLLDDGLDGDVYAGDGVYSGSWTPSTAGTYTLEFPGQVMHDYPDGIGPDTIEIHVDPFLKTGFPQRLYRSGGSTIGLPLLLVADLDGGGDQEIVASGWLNGPNYAWKSDGSLLPGWPLQRNGRMHYAGHFAAGNLDGNPATFEIMGSLADDGRTVPSDSGLGDPLEAYSASGQLLPGWPTATHNYIRVAPALADIDHDGRDEIFIGGGDGYLRGITWNANSTSPPVFLQPSLLNDQHVGTPLIADLDADNRPDLVMTGGYNPGLPNSLVTLDLTLPLATKREFMLPAYTQIDSIADVDGDGLLNIVGLSQEPDGNGGAVAVVRILDPNGETRRTFRYTTDSFVPETVTVADLTQDGIPEIVVGLSSLDSYWLVKHFELTALDGMGRTLPGFPVTLVSSAPVVTNVPTMSAITVGDADGDRLPEIVTNVNGQLFVVNHDGTPAAGSPHLLPVEFRFDNVTVEAPVIADLDADGRNDIVLRKFPWTGYSGWYPDVYAYDMRGPAAHGPIEWGQAGGGPRRTNYYETGKNLATDAYLAIHTAGDGMVLATGSAAECQEHCLRRFARHSTVQLTAEPRNGGVFERWAGACAGQGASCTLNISAYTATRAVFSRQRLDVTVDGPGRVSSDLPGIQCPSVCTAEYRSTDVVILTASPDNIANGASFVGWSGYSGCTGTSNSCTIPMTSARSVRARFEHRRNLSLTVYNGGAGGSVSSSPAGIDQCVAQCGRLFDYGTLVVLTATVSPGYSLRWSNRCPNVQGNTCEVLMDEQRSITASFMPDVRVTVTKTGNGSGSVASTPAGINCGATCSMVVPYETSLEFSAVPAADSVFMGWVSGCGAGGIGNCFMGAYQDTTLTAQFALKIPVRVTIQGSGTVSSLAPGILCTSSCDNYLPPNNRLELHATPASGHMFTGWSGACQGSSSVCTTDTFAARDVTATFVAMPVLSVSVAGNGTISSGVAGINCGSACSQAYLPGSQVRLTAVPQAENTFDGWGGACTGTATTCDVTMSEARNVTASFTPWPVLTVTRSGAGTGSVSSAPSGISCGTDCTETLSPGSPVTLTATASAGSNFSGWAGACNGTTATCSVTVSAATSVTANFAVTPPSSSSSSSGGSKGGGGGGGRVDPAWLALAISLLFWRMRHTRRKGVGL